MKQALSFVRDGGVRAHDGSFLKLAVETLCLHGDTPGAPAIATAVRAALVGAGVTVRAAVIWTVKPRVVPFGESALLVELGEEFQENRVGWARGIAGYWETIFTFGPAVPAYTSACCISIRCASRPNRPRSTRTMIARGDSCSYPVTSAPRDQHPHDI